MCVRMVAVILTLSIGCWPALPGAELSAAHPEAKPQPVPAEEYPLYNRVIETKFLTSQTEKVLIGRLTVVKLGPGERDVPSQAYFQERPVFEGLIESALLTDFILKNSKPARLEERFTLDVPYRFVSEDGIEAPEVSLAPIPAAWPLPVQTAPTTVGVLRFSRVGLAPRRDLALVYVEEDRPDGSGAGFLMLLRRNGRNWEFVDTDVLWTARPE